MSDTNSKDADIANAVLIAGIYDENPIEPSKQLKASQYAGELQDVQMYSLGRHGSDMVHVEINTSSESGTNSEGQNSNPLTGEDDEVGKEIGMMLDWDVAEQLAVEFVELIERGPAEFSQGTVEVQETEQ